MNKNNPTIWLAYVSYPITTAIYIERVLKTKYKVISCGPKLPDETIKLWKLENMKLPIDKLDISTGFQLDLKDALNQVHKDHHPDLFLWVESVNGYFPENIKGNGFPTACYLIDSHMNLSFHLKWAKNFDYVFIAQREYLPDFKNSGIENVFWLPLGCDPGMLPKKADTKLYDIGFVGSLHEQFNRRSILLEKLKSNYKVNYKRCFGEEMAEFFSSSKIVFNNAVKNDLNMRVFEVMSTGSFLLTDNAKNSGQEEMFKDGEDYGLYNDDNIVDIAGYYLKNENKREKIALHGQQIVHNAHTYSHRCEELLKVCFGEKNNTPSPEEWRDRSLAPLKSSINVGSQKEKIMKGNVNKMKRSFIIPVLDMSPASPFNIVKLLDDLSAIDGEVIVIFNSREMGDKLKDHPRIDYYAIMKENVGVSRAWNIGLNISQAPVSFILNSDLHIQKESVDKIEEFLLEVSDAAIAGPQGAFLNFKTLNHIAYFDKGSFDKPFAVDAVSGFFFAVKTELFNSGALKFDNQFTPCYSEEWDIGMQCKMIGLKTYVVPVKGYEHEWSGSIRVMKTVKYLNKEETLGAIYERNRKLFVDKWNGIAQINNNPNLLVSSWADIMSSLAGSLIEENKTDKAIEVFNKILAEYPDNVEILTKLALLYYNNNMLEKALDYFNKIVEINPEFQISNNLFNDPNSFKNSEKTLDKVSTVKKSGSPRPITKRITDYFENPRTDIQPLVNQNSKKILDVGCGSGKMAFDIKNKLNAEVWGIELDNEAAGIAADRLDYAICDKIENSLIKLPNNYFDTIIFADVLEHLVNPYLVLEHIKEKLTDNGEIIASIPNIRYWPVITYLIEGHWTYQDSGILDRTHLRFFTFESINEMFLNAGYLIENSYTKMVNSIDIPQDVINSFTKVGINATTLNNEGKCFQFIVRAKKKL